MYVIIMWLLFGLTQYCKKVRRCLRKVNRCVPLFNLSPQEIQEELQGGETIPFDETHLPYRIFDDNEDQ
jgi:hypothetical protein